LHSTRRAKIRMISVAMALMLPPQRIAATPTEILDLDLPVRLLVDIHWRSGDDGFYLVCSGCSVHVSMFENIRSAGVLLDNGGHRQELLRPLDRSRGEVTGITDEHADGFGSARAFHKCWQPL
jgi:hypothetical protein